MYSEGKGRQNFRTAPHHYQEFLCNHKAQVSGPRRQGEDLHGQKWALFSTALPPQHPKGAVHPKRGRLMAIERV